MNCPYCDNKMEHIINEYYNGWEDYYECYECGCCIGERLPSFINPDEEYDNKENKYESKKY